MNKELSRHEIGEFLDLLASKNPAPGGGTAAAFAGAMAAALIEMVCGLTIGKKKYAGFEKRARALLRRARVSRRRLLRWANDDSRAFLSVMRAYKTRDIAKIRKALRDAIAVPKKVMEECAFLAVVARELSRSGNRNAISDAQSARYLARAGYDCAKANITLNEKMMKKL